MTTGRLHLRQRHVFVDSSAYLALLDRRDEYHAKATEILRALSEQRLRTTTTSSILIEAHALILSSLGGDQARQFLLNVDRSNTTIVQVRSRDEAAARSVIFQYTDKAFSFTDAISFVVMERLGIYLAFSFDSDFEQYGFTRLTSDLVRGS